MRTFKFRIFNSLRIFLVIFPLLLECRAVSRGNNSHANELFLSDLIELK